MPTVKRPSPPWQRQRSLARLEATIADQKLACARWRTWAEGLEAAGRSGRSARGLLLVAEQRLAQLERSRAVLLHGEEGEDEPA